MLTKVSIRPASFGGLVAFLFIFSAAAFAIQGVAVAPPRFEILASPGDSFTKEVAVFAQDTGHQTIVPSVVNWVLTPDGQVVVLPAGAEGNDYGAADWISTSYDPFGLDPDKPVKVKFSINVPGGDLSGSYWAALAFTTEPKPGRYEGVSVLVNTRVLSIVYVTIQGTEQPAAALQGVTLQTDEQGRKFVLADVANKGNVYLRLNGELRFVDAKGEVARRVQLPERVLLRDGLVRYKLAVPTDLPEDVVLAAIEIQPQGPAKSYGGPPLYGEVSLR
jgi:hypothetical protein